VKKVLDMGFYISFPGTITFKKNVEFSGELIKKLPLDRILIETDSPFLTPEPYRGKRNEPAYVKYVAKKIAEFRGLSLEKVAEITTNNCLKVFNIPVK
jgi:TatD DNase family protein